MNKIFAVALSGAFLAMPVVAGAAASNMPNDPMARQEAVEQRVRDASRGSGVREDYQRTMRKAQQEYQETKTEVERDASREYRTVKNDVREDSRTVGEYFDDATITAEVKGKILTQRGLDSLDISVTTNDGIVTLNGSTKEAAQISLAEKVAREVKGVKSVQNNLQSSTSY